MSATIGPDVALVSAAMTTPPSNIAPTIVVPVLVALGNGTPCACRAALRLWFEKSKPGMAAEGVSIVTHRPSNDKKLLQGQILLDTEQFR